MALLIALALLFLALAHSETEAKQPSDPQTTAHERGAKQAVAPAGKVARGRYLANEVAMCVQCHTPRDAEGKLDETRLFAGATIPLVSPFPGHPWATQSPAIAGGGSYDDADIVSVLTTGHRRDGKSPSPPMPPFRLTHDDAAAVVAYLHSLSVPQR